MSDTVWTVDEYCDRIKERNTDVVNKEEERFHRPITRFPSKKEAIDFMCYRAKQRVETAKAVLVGERKRLTKCLRLQERKP